MNYLAIPEVVWLGLGWLPLALAALGGIGLAGGLWGARRGWEPRCRRCGHDLRGLAHDARACPECGADLTRANAVHAGRRRVRATRVALALLVLAGSVAGQMLLANGGVTRLRTSLVARMPAEDLVFEILSRGSSAELAQSTLAAQLMAAPTRQMPSGELLDALLAAGRRYEEAGLGPMAAGLQLADVLAMRLDDPERTRLAELAVAELLGSGGAKRALLGFAEQVARRQTPMQVDVWALIVERLAQTPEGRELLLPEPVVRSAASGERIVVDFQSMVDSSPGAPRSLGFARRRSKESADLAQYVAVERVEFRPEDPSASSIELFPIPEEQRATIHGSQTLELLADLPPGRGTLVLKGLTVPQSKGPSGDGFGAGFGPRMQAARARAIEGARPYERAVEIEVAAPVARTVRLDVDATRIEAMRDDLTRSEIRTRAGWGATIELELDGTSRNAAPASAYAFDVEIEQQGRPRAAVGTVSGSGGGRSTTGGQFPEDVDLARPFRIILTPNVAAALQRSETVELLWARFEMSFSELDAVPVVTSVALPDRAGTFIVSLTGPAIEARLEALAARLPPPSLDVRGAGQVVIWPTPTWTDEHDAGQVEPDPFADLRFCGTFEARVGDRLAAPPRRWIGPLGLDHGPGLGLELIAGLMQRGPLVVRYEPDPALCPADPSGELRYVGVPFELVYRTPDAAPTLRVVREE